MGPALIYVPYFLPAVRLTYEKYLINILMRLVNHFGPIVKSEGSSLSSTISLIRCDLTHIFQEPLFCRFPVIFLSLSINFVVYHQKG